DGAGRDRVDGDAVFGQLQRPGARAPDQRALGGRIAGALVAAVDDATAYVDDAAGAAHFHGIDECLRDLHRHAHVQVHDAVERGQVDFAQGLRAHDADVVDDGV